MLKRDGPFQKPATEMSGTAIPKSVVNVFSLCIFLLLCGSCLFILFKSPFLLISFIVQEAFFWPFDTFSSLLMRSLK